MGKKKKTIWEKLGFLSEMDYLLWDDDMDREETEEEEAARYGGIIGMAGHKDIPEGCRACGGDYPDCTSSCPLFDD